jgi:hypothetical protein
MRNEKCACAMTSRNMTSRNMTSRSMTSRSMASRNIGLRNMASRRSIAGTGAMSIFTAPAYWMVSSRSFGPRARGEAGYARYGLLARSVCRWHEKWASAGAPVRRRQHSDFTKKLHPGGGQPRSIATPSGAASAACFLRNTSPKSVKPACDLGSSSLHPGSR